MSKATEAMKKAIDSANKSESALKVAQKEVQKQDQKTSKEASVVSSKETATQVKTNKPMAHKKPDNKKSGSKHRTMGKKMSFREAVKKASDKVHAKVVTESPEVTVKVQVNTNTLPWESSNTIVSMATPKLPETTLINKTTNPKPTSGKFGIVDNTQNRNGPPASKANYAGFGQVNTGFSKN